MKEVKSNSILPWTPGATPLMLAPMQGITNRGLRALFVERYKPDIVFTEFVRVRPGSKKVISANDKLEVLPGNNGTPLVVQLIGRDNDALVAAAETVQELGAKHLNINLGCPYGRMSGNSAGGALLRDTGGLSQLLSRLRENIMGSFSVKVRAGYDDPFQIISLVELFEDCGVDFLIVHPRTVLQKYSGKADHTITAEVVRRSSLPVIANGDIFSAQKGKEVLKETSAAGLMLGRGAITDPFLFERLRGGYQVVSSNHQRIVELQDYFMNLLERYHALFCGEHQILCKMKAVLSQIHDPDFSKRIRSLKRSRRLAHFAELLAGFSD